MASAFRQFPERIFSEKLAFSNSGSACFIEPLYIPYTLFPFRKVFGDVSADLLF